MQQADVPDVNMFLVLLTFLHLQFDDVKLYLQA